jgi:hypothetical protein
LEKNQNNKICRVLIDNWQWKFIQDGIMTIPFKKAIEKREVYLYEEDYLNHTEDERAQAIFQGNVIFESSAELAEFCGKNNIEIRQVMLVL